jgi:MFS transporter, Spinster family, sphingosine-1-phosphate transporter
MLNATHDWRIAFYVFGIVGIIPAIIVLFLPDYKAERKQGEGVLSKAYFRQWGELFKIKSYWLFIISTTLLYFFIFAILAWVPTLVLRAYPDMNTLQVGMAMGAVGLLNIFAPVGGIVADRWQKRNKVGRPLFLVLATFFGLATVLASTFIVGKVPFQAYLPVYIATALILAFLAPVMNVVVHDVIPVPVRAVAVGIMLTVAQLGGGVLGPVFVGLVSDATGGGAKGIINGIFWTVPVAALSIITTLIMTRYYAGDSARISDVVMAEK